MFIHGFKCRFVAKLVDHIIDEDDAHKNDEDDAKKKLHSSSSSS